MSRGGADPVIAEKLFYVVISNGTVSIVEEGTSPRETYLLSIRAKDEYEAQLRLAQYSNEIVMDLYKLNGNVVVTSGACENPVVLATCPQSSSWLSKGIRDFANFTVRTLMNNTEMAVAACNDTATESATSQSITDAVNRMCQLLHYDCNDGALFSCSMPEWASKLIGLTLGSIGLASSCLLYHYCVNKEKNKSSQNDHQSSLLGGTRRRRGRDSYGALQQQNQDPETLRPASMSTT